SRLKDIQKLQHPSVVALPSRSKVSSSKHQHQNMQIEQQYSEGNTSIPPSQATLRSDVGPITITFNRPRLNPCNRIGEFITKQTDLSI
ncbi:7320_t:CDS:1, partial [Ambispora gerdemannii]